MSWRDDYGAKLTINHPPHKTLAPKYYGSNDFTSTSLHCDGVS